MKHTRLAIRVLLAVSIIIYGLTAPMAIAAEVQQVPCNLNIDSIGLPAGDIYGVEIPTATPPQMATVKDGIDLVFTTHLGATITYSIANPLWTPWGAYKVLDMTPASGFTLDAVKTLLITYQSTSITGYVFGDYNGNGIWDAGEPGYPNVPVTLLGTEQVRREGGEISSAVVAPGGPASFMTSYTNSDGFYQFDNLPAGTFFVIATLPGGDQNSGPITITDTGNGLTAGQANFPQTAQMPYTGR
jgi:hypothetical protein